MEIATRYTQIENKHEEKKIINIETIKRKMSEKKIILPSVRNPDWKIAKAETEKINELLTHIPTNNGIKRTNK